MIYKLQNDETYLPDCNHGNNILFQYYDIGVVVFKKQENDNPYTLRFFEIDKNQDQIWIGNSSGNVTISGKSMQLLAAECFNMYLGGGASYAIEFSFTLNEIIFKITSNLNLETYNKEIDIPFDMDLGNLESRLADVEDIDSTINNIHNDNPYVGLDPLHVVLPN
jgi:hypothetical protein